MINEITNGAYVNTKFGPGQIVGIESGYSTRVVVLLDDPSRWAFGDVSKEACFYPKEITVLSPITDAIADVLVKKAVDTINVWMVLGEPLGRSIERTKRDTCTSQPDWNAVAAHFEKAMS